MPVQTISPFIDPSSENSVPTIDRIIEDEEKILGDISGKLSWNAVPGYTIEGAESSNPVRSIVSTIQSGESKLSTLAPLSAAYSQQMVRISRLEEEAANEQLSGYEKDRAVEQARTNAGGWSLVNTFSSGYRIFEPRVFEGNFNRIGRQGVIVYHPEKVDLNEEDGGYLFQETAGIRGVANKVGLNTRQVDEYNPLYILLSPGSDPLTSGVCIENKILLTNIENLSDQKTRAIVSHELTHASFGLTPILDHTEGLSMLLSGLRHPGSVNPYEYGSSELATALAERLESIPLSSGECIAVGADVTGKIKNFSSSDFNYVYGYNFAMSFFEYFADEGPEYAFEKYMEFYGVLKRGIIFSSQRAEPLHPERSAMLVQAGEKLPGISDSEVTQEALMAIGVDPDKFKKDLGKTMRRIDSVDVQKDLSQKLVKYFN